MSGLVWLWADRFPNRTELLPSLHHQHSISNVALACAAPGHVCLGPKLPHSSQHKCKPRFLFLNPQEPQGLPCFTSAKSVKEGTKGQKKLLLLSLLLFLLFFYKVNKLFLPFQNLQGKSNMPVAQGSVLLFYSNFCLMIAKPSRARGPDGDAPCRVGVCPHGFRAVASADNEQKSAGGLTHDGH